MLSGQAGDAQGQSKGGSPRAGHRRRPKAPRAGRWGRAAAAFLVAWLLTAGGLSGASLQGLAAPPASEAEEPPPLPYVRGPSRWAYQSNLGPARVSLDELGVEGDARLYTWAIEVAGARMAERLRLTREGLFIAARQFWFLGLSLARLELVRPELVVAAPLEVGHRWSVTWEGNDPARPGRAPVQGRLEGVIEALEPVQVPAGHFVAYRIRLRRTDSQGSRTDTIIWLDPHLGVVKADGELLWPGAVGAVQRLLGLSALRVELTEAHLHGAAPDRPPPPGEAAAAR